MGEVYPDLYGAIGVHSGLACGVARDVHSALAAMKSGAGSVGPDVDGRWRSNFRRTVVPAIVFHGDRDTTVNPRNGDAVAAQFSAGTVPRSETGQIAGGHSYTRIVHTSPGGQSVAEQWVVHGGGHAWFGGSSAGSFTDPSGPDATAEMLRFFLEHARDDALAAAHVSEGRE
jgi:poly(3-hydroxybutyrate) depolymerase